MKILLLDIETSPNLAFVWGLFKQNIGINQIEQSGSVLCWTAKWYGEEKIYFDSVHKSSEQAMLARIHQLVDDADAVVHYNGASFDLPVLNREWLKHGFKPPAPYKHIDLLQVCKKQFRFVSNKLDYVSQFLGLGEKVRHQGHELWVGCMRGDPECWRVMEDYNIQDVALLEQLYDRLLPWIEKHPSHGAFAEDAVCPKCGSKHFQQRGTAITTVMKYKRYQCKDCGGWFRGNKSVMVRNSDERMLNIAA